MKLHTLPKITTRSKKRVGRGYGSGKGGHTTGRGTKGLKARGKIRVGFEGGQTSLVSRLPLRRGKGNLSAGKKPLVVNVKYLNLLPKNTLVTVDTLITNKIVKKDEAQKYGIKILGDGKLTVPLKVNLPTSKMAAKKNKEAGGETVNPKTKNLRQKKKSETRNGKRRKGKNEKNL